MRAILAIVSSGLVLALAGCGGGGGNDSSSGAASTVTVTTTETIPTGSTATNTTTTPSTNTTAVTGAVDVVETAMWSGDAFKVSDVETSDTEPVADLLGEKAEAENGVWLSFKITPAEDNSGIWSTEFTDNMQIRGGDGKIYGCGGAVDGCDGPVSDQSVSSSAGVQNELGESDFLVWVDIPEAAVSGAVLEVTDNIDNVPDPPTLVNLGS